MCEREGGREKEREGERGEGERKNIILTAIQTFALWRNFSSRVQTRKQTLQATRSHLGFEFTEIQRDFAIDFYRPSIQKTKCLNGVQVKDLSN